MFNVITCDTFSVLYHNHIEGNMKICVSCNNEFKPVGREQACSIKCKLMSNIEKTESGCWIWKGNTGGSYGKLRWRQKFISTHKASFLTFKGEIPEGKWVCHQCDQPLCINPEHLFIGSPSDNRKDAVNKKRIPLGEKNHFSKYTDIQVEEIRILKKEGFTYKRLQRIFNCSIAYLLYIVKNKIRKEA